MVLVRLGWQVRAWPADRDDPSRIRLAQRNRGVPREESRRAERAFNAQRRHQRISEASVRQSDSGCEDHSAWARYEREIGRAHACTPVPNAHTVSRLPLGTTNTTNHILLHPSDIKTKKR